MATADGVNLPQTAVEGKPNEQARPESRLAHLARHVPDGAWRYLLVLADALLILLGFTISYFVRYELQLFRAVEPAFAVDFSAYVPSMFAYLGFLLLTFFLSDVYPYRPGRSWIEEVYTIGVAVMAGTALLIIVNLFFSVNLLSRLLFLYAAVIVTTLLAIGRMGIQVARRHLRRYGVGIERVVLVGAGEVGRMVMRTVAARPDYGYKLLGFFDDNPTKGATDIGPFKALGSVDSVEPVLDTMEIDTLIICLPWQSHRRIQSLLRMCDQRGVRAQVVPDLFQLTKNQMEVQDLNGIPLISTREVSIRGWNLFIKRGFDLTLAIGFAVFGLPVYLPIALAIRLDSPGPVLYAQERVGRNGKLFKCYKFRSMIDGADTMRADLTDLNEATGPLFKLRNDPRRTRVGRFLRRYSLDEIPQLINVLRGDMSLVGPRPNRPEEAACYEEWHKRRLTVSPGISGLWQVSGRSDLTFDEMVLLDIYYVENWNLFLDLSILLRSIPAVIRARGAY